MIFMKFLHFRDFLLFLTSGRPGRGGVPGRGKGETEEGWQDGRMDGRTGGSEEDWEVGEDGEHGQDGGGDGRLGGWEDGCEDGRMGGWVGGWHGCVQ